MGTVEYTLLGQYSIKYQFIYVDIQLRKYGIDEYRVYSRFGCSTIMKRFHSFLTAFNYFETQCASLL